MQTLSKGQFLGNAEYYRETMGIVGSVTSYTTGDHTADLVHYHEHPNFYFILNDGSIEKRKGVQSEQAAGSLLFYHAGEVHQNIRKGANPRSLNIEIDRALLKELDVVENNLKRNVLESREAKFAMLSVYHELIAGDSLTNVSVQLLLLKLLSYSDTVRHYNTCPQWVTTIRDVLNDRWNETINLHELSVLAGVHPITISKHFPVYFTDSFGQYMRKLKIEKALLLIKSTDLGLTEIAYECGFADQSHFTRLFKKYTGFLPLQFRKL